jgi:hypothetical protein
MKLDQYYRGAVIKYKTNNEEYIVSKIIYINRKDRRYAQIELLRTKTDLKTTHSTKYKYVMFPVSRKPINKKKRFEEIMEKRRELYRIGKDWKDLVF